MNPNEILDPEIAYIRLRDSILRGKYEQGDRLTTQRLAEEFGVSRTPVREALARLETDGLAKRVDGWGYLVRSITLRSAEEIFEARLVIEVAAADLAAKRVTESDIKDMSKCLHKARVFMEKGDLVNFQVQSRGFHKSLVRATGNEVLYRMFMQLNDLVLLFGVSLLRVSPSRAGEIVLENQKVLDAIQSNDSELSSKHMHDHIKKGHETFRLVSRLIRPELTIG